MGKSMTKLEIENDLIEANQELRESIFDYIDKKPDSARQFLNNMKRVSRLTYEAMMKRIKERHAK